MNNSIIFPLVLQILGIVIILAEFVVPSMGLLTVTATGAFGYSIYLVYQNFGIESAMILVACDFFIIPLLMWLGVKLLAKSPFALKSALSSDEGNVVQDESLTELTGKKGITVSVLRPAGKALIEDKKYDVVSTGDYIETDTAIKVTAVDGNRIVVKRI